VNGGEIEQCHEAAGGFVVASGDLSEALELAERTLDVVALPTRIGVTRAQDLSIGSRRDDGDRAHFPTASTMRSASRPSSADTDSAPAPSTKADARARSDARPAAGMERDGSPRPSRAARISVEKPAPRRPEASFRRPLSRRRHAGERGRSSGRSTAILRVGAHRRRVEHRPPDADIGVRRSG